MKNIFKTTTFLLLTVLFFQSCTSEECHEESVSEEQQITTELTEKIIATATSKNDYNFFVNNSINSNCDFTQYTEGYFNNPEGDYFAFRLSSIESIDIWLTEYENAKIDAFNATGVMFSNEDFFLTEINGLGGFDGVNTREGMIEYFETCNLVWDNEIFYLPFTDVSLNCDSNADINFTIFDNNTGIANFTTVGLNPIEDVLTDYNTQNNTNYSLEDLTVTSVVYTPNNETIILRETDRLANYFENCMLSRDATINDCLNFVYPFEVNRFSLQLEEVITTTIENDEDLITTFNTDVGELGFVYPISLIGQNGTVVSIENNEELENALDNASNYCN